ncbi:MAG: histidine--tRNA ligase family protein [Thermogemmatispora sp.]|jgi:ATP phosphoribosyltransferase regulatory subunit|uniref:Histidine--tRNA ligase n=1 Tax=Thermogemmatispora aurantia TaxID=2045279 RepID=A0A5J4KA69_9CHLR|nr:MULTISPECIES: HisS family protein [Thermogemmatispora]MBE3564131.1 histidine--tRNA ligase family protein [Thermogemmatispora sp.]GER83561.1 histidine--tRNA ligase [Thermogemmatispora aurantia]
MKKRIERLRGMHDVLPEAYRRQSQVVDRVRALLEKAGYDPVDTPALERSDLFQASFGQEAWQNLYAFQLHQRELCLRPEYTASICRLYLEHYQQSPLPLRFQYVGPVFRYEAPGRGRYRQHTQLGVELFGGQPLRADGEIVQLACDILHELGITRYRLELGHVGVASGFIERLHLDVQTARLLLSLMEQISRSPEGEQAAQARLEALYPERSLTPSLPAAEAARGRRLASSDGSNQLVAALLNSFSLPFGDEDSRREIVERFLWKIGRSEQRALVFSALEFLRRLRALAGPPPEVFQELRQLLQSYQLDDDPLEELEQLVTTLMEVTGVDRRQITLNLALGRGVSYYTGLLFEIHASDEEGLDLQLCGGGRYDHLVEAVGGTRGVRACGFAFGLERLISSMPASQWHQPGRTQALVIPVGKHDLAYACHVARLARSEGGIIAELDVNARGVSNALRQASQRGFRLALIVGEEERQANTIRLHDLLSGKERLVTYRDLAVALREGGDRA